ncbi:MAG TPA: 30S ribosomal protein S12 methylthiotransferase RimO, partial [Phycisphaerae bacterium]
MPEPTKVAFVSLGCAKNLVDSEKMLGQLAEGGCLITSDEAQADVMVINTCGFLAASRAEAVDVIADAVRRKERGRLKRVVVAGCLVQRDGE